MNNNKINIFIGLVFLISYVTALIIWLTGISKNYILFTLSGVIYMFIPTLCVLLVKKFIYKENIISELLVSFKLNKWFLIAWLIMPLTALLTMAISLTFPGVEYSPDMSGMFERYGHLLNPEKIAKMKEDMEKFPINPFLLSIINGMFAGITINAIAAFGEELGWRGFLLVEMKKFNFLKLSIIIGFIWGLWHAPLVLMGLNYPQHPYIGVLMMIIWCILLTPIFLYITIKSKSVIAASILHGTLNGTAGIAIILVKGGNDLTIGITGLAGFLALILVIFAFFIYDIYLSKEKIFYKKIDEIL